MTKDQIPNTKQAPSSNVPNTKRAFDLEARTLRFSRQVIELCQALPKTSVNSELISQVVRAAGSVGANYREANDALSRKDFAYRIRITRKEAKEAEYWLQLLRTANPSLDGRLEGLIQEALEFRKIFSAMATRAS